MTVDDVEDKDSLLIINIPNSKTAVSRTFIVTNGGDEKLDLLSFYRKYRNLRPKNATGRRLFLRYENGKCSNQNVGMNTFGNMPKLIAKYLNLQDANLYTGHCFRRSSATLLADAGGDIVDLKRHGGWKSSSVAEGYLDDSIQNKVEVSRKILGQNNMEIKKSSYAIGNASDNFGMGSGISVANCQSCTINFNIVNK